MTHQQLKHLLIPIIIVLTILLVVVSITNWALTRLVCNELDRNIAAADSMSISYDEVHLRVLTGKVRITKVCFQTDTLAFPGEARQVARAEVPLLSLDGVNYFEWLVHRRVLLRGLTVISPNVRVLFDNQADEFADVTGQELEQQMQSNQSNRKDEVMNIIRTFVDEAVIRRISIEKAHVDATALDSSMNIAFEQATVHLYDIGYRLSDSTLLYNDSVMHFDIQNIRVRIPEANTRLQVNEYRAEKNGIMSIKGVDVITYPNGGTTEYVKTGVREITFGGFDPQLYDHKKFLQVRSLHLYEPYAKVYMNELAQPSTSQPLTSSSHEGDLGVSTQIEDIKTFITGVTIDTLQLHNGQLDFESTNSHLQTHASGVSLALYGIGYSLIDEIPYHYNDSVYQFGVAQAAVRTPDDLVQINTSDISYADGGAFHIGNTHIYHTVDKWDLARRMGEGPATWIDMTVNSVRTSSKNIVKEVFSYKDGFYLDTIYVDVAEMNVFRDNRSKPTKPNTMPQAALLDLEYPFVLRSLKANVDKIHLNVAMSEQAVGELNLNNIGVHVRNVTAIRNSTISVQAQGKVGKGSVNATMALRVNPACNWSIDLKAKNLDFAQFNDLIYPLVGMQFGCDVHSLDTHYGGDSKTASGTFCMIYDNMTIFADKNSSSPFKVIGNLSGLINSAGRTLVTHSNPTKPGQDPRSYNVQWKNDPMQNIALFFIGPVINGSVATLLPGLFIHKRINK